MELTLELTGTKPMLQHNGRLANPIDPYTRKLKAITGKRNKTDEDLIDIMMIEARGACYETEAGMIGIPNAMVWRCIFDASKAYKRGQDIKRALHFDDTIVPLHINGETVTCDDFLKREEHIDYRPVVVQRSRTMRSRPRIDNWKSRHTFTLLDDVIDARNLEPILERAGRLVGIGDWRPTYGQFTVEVIS